MAALSKPTLIGLCLVLSACVTPARDARDVRANVGDLTNAIEGAR